MKALEVYKLTKIYIYISFCVIFIILNKYLNDYIAHKGKKMKRIERILNNIKIKNKLFIIYLVCVLFPIIIINFVFYKDIEERVRMEKVIGFENMLDKIQEEIDETLLAVGGFTNSFYIDQYMYEVLNREYSSGLEFLDLYQSQLKKKIFENIPYYRQIEALVFYTNNPTVLNSGGIQRANTKVIQSSAYQYTPEQGDTMLENGAWISRGMIPNHLNKGMVPCISVYRNLDKYKYLNTYHKVLRVDISDEMLQSILSREALEGHVYLVNEEGETIVASDDKVPLDLAADQIIIEKASHIEGWKIVGTFKEEDIYEAIRPVKRKTYIMAGFSLLIATACIWTVFYSFYKRIDDMIRHMSQLENEEFNLLQEGEESKDEIGILIKSLNQMSFRLRTLIQNKYQMEIKNTKIALESRQAELNALQSQVDPHFMFNALEALRFRSLIKQEKETAKMIKYMSKMFRKLIDWNQDWITVGEEIEFIMEFLEIQKYRFDDELKFEIAIQEEVKGYKIPKMILQPLVENACIHGVENITGSRHIQITGYKKGETLCLSVEDNGTGMEKEKIHQILSHIQDSHYQSNSVGLRNVFRRLVLYYGEESHFNIESEKGKYTKITLIMPIREHKEG